MGAEFEKTFMNEILLKRMRYTVEAQGTCASAIREPLVSQFIIP